MKPLFSILSCFLVLSCQPGNSQVKPENIRQTGNTLAERFPVPAGAARLPVDPNSFAMYLRNFPLKPDSTPVRLYNGQLKNTQDVHAAVLKIDVGARDLQQCADAIMRLRAEYLWQQKRYADIHFNFTNGFRADYARWRAGERIRVTGNQVRWVPGASASLSRESFREYLNLVFMYAGTASLEQELHPVMLDSILPGDVFIRGGHPGHAVMVIDVAADSLSGERYFLLAQSYMPAQDIHVLQNFNNPSLSPWYAVSEIGDWLETPEWDFKRGQLRRW